MRIECAPRSPHGRLEFVGVGGILRVTRRIIQRDAGNRIGVLMTYRGTVKGGVVVFSKSPRLKDGTQVRVEPVKSPRKASPGRKRRGLHPVGKWEGEEGELQRLLGEVQLGRDSDLALERDASR
jgi:hypothetical protein